MKKLIGASVAIIMMYCIHTTVIAADLLLSDYITNVAKPTTITNRIDTNKQRDAALTKYPTLSTLLDKGNFIGGYYAAYDARRLDILGRTIDIYRKQLIETGKSQNSSSCQGITNRDITNLMSIDVDLFTQMIVTYPTLSYERVLINDLAQSCRKWVSCYGSYRMSQFEKETSIEKRVQMCNDVASIVFTDVAKNTLSVESASVTQYNNLYANGVVEDSSFDVMVDVKKVSEIFVEKSPEPVQYDMVENDQTSSLNASTLPNELITSTQQLVDRLMTETTVDPRNDAQISSLMNQFTTVSSSTVNLPVGNILNACMIDTQASVSQTQDEIIKKLEAIQQSTKSYINALDTDTIINDVINNKISIDSVAPMPIQLSAINEVSITKDTNPVVPLKDNPLGSMLSAIDNNQAGQSDNSTTTAVVESLGITKESGQPSVRQCMGSCQENYGNKCSQKCKSSGQGEKCEEKCNNAKIVCLASCLCGSTSPTNSNAETTKLQQMFELRRCIAPTNKLRGVKDQTCVRIDPIDGPQPPSLECLLDKNIDYSTYNKESGKGGLRIKPREWYQLPIDFKLKNMINFPINIVSRAPQSDPKKKETIEESKKKQNLASWLAQDPSVTNLKQATDLFNLVDDFNSSVLNLVDKAGANVEAIGSIMQS